MLSCAAGQATPVCVPRTSLVWNIRTSPRAQHPQLSSRVHCCKPNRMSEGVEAELLKLQQDLLQSIADRNWSRYAELCDNTLTAFEPEAVGHLVQGLPFHKYYFDYLLKRTEYNAPTNTISQPHVRMLGADAAVVSYVRLQQKVDSKTLRPVTLATEETRVWQRKDGKWRNVHFHRSPPSAP